jgi:hypothetical protein
MPPAAAPPRRRFERSRARRCCLRRPCHFHADAAITARLHISAFSSHVARHFIFFAVFAIISLFSLSLLRHLAPPIFVFDLRLLSSYFSSAFRRRLCRHFDHFRHYCRRHAITPYAGFRRRFFS